MTTPNTNPSDLDQEALNKAYEAYDKAFPESGFITYEGLRAGIRAYLAAIPRASGVPEAEALLKESQDYYNKWEAEHYAAPLPIAAPSGEAEEDWSYRRFNIECCRDTTGDEWQERHYAANGEFVGALDYAELLRLFHQSAVPVSSLSTDALTMADSTAQTGPFTTGQKIVARWESAKFAEPCELAQWIDDAVATERSYCAEFIRNWNWSFPPPATYRSILRAASDALVATPPSPIASEPKDAGSGEGQEINRFGLVKALTAYDRYWENNDDASEALQCAIEAYLAFTRTAPSGAKS